MCSRPSVSTSDVEHRNMELARKRVPGVCRRLDPVRGRCSENQEIKCQKTDIRTDSRIGGLSEFIRFPQLRINRVRIVSLVAVARVIFQCEFHCKSTSNRPEHDIPFFFGFRIFFTSVTSAEVSSSTLNLIARRRSVVLFDVPD